MARTYTCDDCDKPIHYADTFVRTLLITDPTRKKMHHSITLGHHCASCVKKRVKVARAKHQPQGEAPAA